MSVHTGSGENSEPLSIIGWYNDLGSHPERRVRQYADMLEIFWMMGESVLTRMGVTLMRISRDGYPRPEHGEFLTVEAIFSRDVAVGNLLRTAAVSLGAIPTQVGATSTATDLMAVRELCRDMHSADVHAAQHLGLDFGLSAQELALCNNAMYFLPPNTPPCSWQQHLPPGFGIQGPEVIGAPQPQDGM